MTFYTAAHPRFSRLKAQAGLRALVLKGASASARAEMVDLNFDVKVDIVMNGRICSPGSICSSAPSMSGGPGDLLASLAESVSPTDVKGFYLAAWIGAGSQEFSLGRIDASGEAQVRKLKVKPGDVDTLKLAVAFKWDTRCCHLASSFVSLSELSSALSEAPPQASPQKFTSAQKCMALKDNFTSNKAALRFSNAGTDLRSLSKLNLRSSALSSLSQTSDAVEKLSAHLKDTISHCAVSPLNAGVQFMESVTFGDMAGQMTHYALLGHLFRSMSSPVGAAQLAYYGYQTMHSTDLSFDALHRMPDTELALRFGDPLITRHTACDLTTEYKGDMTMNAMGQVCRATESISKTFCALGAGVRADLDESVYAGAGQSVAGLSLAMAMDQLDRAGVTRASRGPQPAASTRISKALEVDDCENLSLANMLVARGLMDACEACGSEKALASQIAREAKGSPLFANCTDSHHANLARVLFRLGAMLKSGDYSTSFLVASAKAASYSLDHPDSASTLSGHGAAITRVRDATTGQYVHAAVEGTTYATVDRPMPEGYPSVLPIKLAAQTGEPEKVVAMNLAELMTSIAQNVHKDLGLSQRTRVQAHFLPEYKDPQDCPFYVSAFYTGLSEGSKGSIACIPVDTCPAPNFLAGEKPLFGAPVMGLSKPSTMAIPISAETFAVAGVAEPEKVLKLMTDQVEEAWPPMMTKSQLKSVMSYWQPVASPDSPRLTGDNYASHLRSENCWGFDDPRHTALAVRVLGGLAERFNELQAKDPASDGARAAAFGQFLSAALRVTLPVPKKTDKFSLSTMRNLRKAADDIGLSKLSACPVRAKMIGARAKIKSRHGFYMCDRGEGLVHAYNRRLA